MKRSFHAGLNLLFIFILLFAFPNAALANEGEGGSHQEVEVDGYHVTLESQEEWVKGENTLVVTITDSMGMPLSNAEVEILIAPKAEGHGASETDDHASGEEEAMSGMDMDAEPTQEPEPGVMRPNNPSEMNAHEEESDNALAMTESEHGMYTIETHLDATGEHDVHVMFHVDGEMLQADFVVQVAGPVSKNAVLWSFAAVNVVIVAAAGALKKQKSITVKGGK